MPLVTCPSREELSSYVLGKLPEDSSAAFDEHLLECTKCQTALETMAITADSLLADLQRPASQQEYFAESECQEAMALVQAIGREPSIAGKSAADSVVAESQDLGQIRDYRLLAKLGEGGMGTVYKALHIHLNKVVALKLLPKQQTTDEQAVARFKREMLAVGALEHPNIVRATDAGQHEGVHFLVMEYVKGQDLSKISKQHGPLPVAEACELIREAAVGLQHAHEHGLIHRDIKPSNLMLTDTGEVKILDLGLALLQEHQADNARDLTSTGQMMGTLDYMAPEQGDDSHEVDIRADIYALGATLYKLLCGEAPLGSSKYNSAVKKLMALATEEPQSIAARRNDLPIGQGEVVHKMLAKEPVARYATPTDVVAALEPFATGADLRTLLPAKVDSQSDGPAGEHSLPSTSSHLSSSMTGTSPFEERPSRLPPPSRRLGSQQHSFLPSLLKLKSRRAKFVATTVALLVAALAAAAIYLMTDRGELVIENNNPDLKVLIKQSGRIVREWELEQGKNSLRLWAGQYEISLEGPFDTLKLDQRTITVRRGDVVAATIRHIERLAGSEDGERTTWPKPAFDIKPDPPTLRPGDPISRMALVTRPAKLPGVASWTIDTKIHRGAILSVAYSPDGRWIATGANDGTIRVHEANSGRLVRAIAGHDHMAYQVKWLPDSRVLVTIDYRYSQAGTVRFWDAGTGRLLRKIGPFQLDPVLALGPDGHRFAYSEGEIRICETATGNVLPSLSKAGQATAIAWSPDGRYIAQGKGNVILWNTDKSVRVRELEQKPGNGTTVRAIVWSSDAKLVLANGDRSLVRIWDAETGELRRELNYMEGQDLSCFALSPDGRTLYGGGTYYVRAWNLQNGTQRDFENVPRPIHCLATSPDGKRLTLGTANGELWSVDVKSGERVFSTAGSGIDVFRVGMKPRLSPSVTRLALCRGADRIPAVSIDLHEPATIHKTGPMSLEFAFWSPDSSKIAFTLGGPKTVWSADLKHRLHTLQNTERGANRGNDMAWSPDGKWLAALGEDRIVRGFNSETAKAIRFEGHTDSVNVVAWSLDGQRIASGSKDKSVIVWNFESGKAVHVLQGLDGPIDHIAWSPDGKTLAASDSNYEVAIWNTETGERLPLEFDGRGMGVILQLVFSPNSKTLASVGNFAGAFWEVETGRRVYPSGKLGGTVKIEFSADSRRIFTVGHKNSCCVYDLDNEELVSEHSGHLPWVDPSALDWSHEADLVVSSAPGQQVHLWQASTGNPIAAIAMLDEHAVYISPEGHYLAAEEVGDDLIYIVQTDTGEQRMLTPSEFEKQYGWKNDPSKVRLIEIQEQADPSPEATSNAAPPQQQVDIQSATSDNESSPGLVGHWSFDEGEGLTTKDASGNGHHGTLKNMDAAAWVTAESGDLPPVPGNRAALKFDGDDDVVTVPYDAAFDLDGPFTLSAWIRRPAEPTLNRYERIIDHHFVNGYAFVIMNMKGLKGQTAMHIAGGKAIAYNSHGPSVLDGKWHHVAAVCDGSELRIFQDGRPLVKGRIKRGTPTTKAPLAFGNNGSTLPGEEGFHGMLDDIRIYDRALSDAEVKAIAIAD